MSKSATLTDLLAYVRHYAPGAVVVNQVALHDEPGYHQVWIRLGSHEQALELAELLEDQGLEANAGTGAPWGQRVPKGQSLENDLLVSPVQVNAHARPPRENPPKRGPMDPPQFAPCLRCRSGEDLPPSGCKVCGRRPTPRRKNVTVSWDAPWVAVGVPDPDWMPGTVRGPQKEFVYHGETREDATRSAWGRPSVPDEYWGKIGGAYYWFLYRLTPDGYVDAVPGQRSRFKNPRRRNSDAERRELERAAKSGDAVAKARLVAAEERDGVLQGVVQAKPFWFIRVVDRKGATVWEGTHAYDTWHDRGSYNQRKGEMPSGVFDVAWYALKKVHPVSQALVEKPGNVVAIWRSRQLADGRWAVLKGWSHSYSFKMRKQTYPGGVWGGIAGYSGQTNRVSQDLVGLADYKPKKAFINPLTPAEVLHVTDEARKSISRSSARDLGPLDAQFLVGQGHGQAMTAFAMSDGGVGSGVAMKDAYMVGQMARQRGVQDRTGEAARRKRNPLPFALIPAIASGVVGGTAWESVKAVARSGDPRRKNVGPAFGPAEAAAYQRVAGALARGGRAAVKPAALLRRAGLLRDWELRRYSPPELAHIATGRLAERLEQRRANPFDLATVVATGVVTGITGAVVGAAAGHYAGRRRANHPAAGAFIWAIGNGPGTCGHQRPQRQVAGPRRANRGAYEIKLPADRVLGTMPLAEAARKWPHLDLDLQVEAFEDMNRGARASGEVVLWDDRRREVTDGYINSKAEEMVYGGINGSPPGSFKNSGGVEGGSVEGTTWVHQSPNQYLVGRAERDRDGKPVTFDFSLIGKTRAKNGWLRESERGE